MSRKALVLYRYLPQWRVDFFNSLRRELSRYQVELTVAYGKSKGDAILKGDEVDLSWGSYVPNRVFTIGRHELYWQPCLQKVKKHDIIIVEQANKLLLNYWLMVDRRFSGRKLCFWGHGLNRQDLPGSIGNKFKKLYMHQCDWWFAYTEGVKNYIVGTGYPPERVTIVGNAIDTMTLDHWYKQVSESELTSIRKNLRLTEGPIGIFCGGMYREKRIEFLIGACDRIREEIPTFEVLFIGSGVESMRVIQASRTRSWIHYLGPKFGRERVCYFKLADVTLMPGLVGLVVLDSFAMQTPLITTRIPFHGPEIEYLLHGQNGWISDNDVDAYAKDVIYLLNHRDVLDKLQEGALKSSSLHTLDAMVSNFASGTLSALDLMP